MPSTCVHAGVTVCEHMCAPPLRCVCLAGVLYLGRDQGKEGSGRISTCLGAMATTGGETLGEEEGGQFAWDLIGVCCPPGGGVHGATGEIRKWTTAESAVVCMELEGHEVS